MSALVATGGTLIDGANIAYWAAQAKGVSASYIGWTRVVGLERADGWYVEEVRWSGQSPIQPLGPFPNKASVLAALRVLVK